MPPAPLVPLPTVIVIEPPVPAVAAPDPIQTVPVVPELEVPELNVITPLTPDVPAFAERIDIAPVDVAVLALHGRLTLALERGLDWLDGPKWLVVDEELKPSSARAFGLAPPEALEVAHDSPLRPDAESDPLRFKEFAS